METYAKNDKVTLLGPGDVELDAYVLRVNKRTYTVAYSVPHSALGVSEATTLVEKDSKEIRRR